MSSEHDLMYCNQDAFKLNLRYIYIQNIYLLILFAMKSIHVMNGFIRCHENFIFDTSLALRVNHVTRNNFASRLVLK